MKLNCFVLLILMGGAATASALDLYFFRHAQTMANVTREYTDENQRIFSPLGEEQVAGVVEKLDGVTFDHLLVSPAWRTLNTILPYLQAHQRTAEIWPELYECCWDQETQESDPQVTQGPAIELDEEWRPFFQFRDPDAIFWLEVDTPARGDLMVEQAVNLLRNRFQSGETVLIVSHYHTSSRIMRALLSARAPRTIRPGNTLLNHLQMDGDGQFHLLLLNDRVME